MTDPHVMTGAYALDALDGADRDAFEQHLAQCEQCRAEVRRLQETLAELGAAEASVPPPTMRERVLREIGRTEQVAGASTGPRVPAMRRLERRAPEVVSHARRWRTAAALLVAAAVAAIAFGLGTWNQQRQHQLVASPAEEVTRVVTAPDAQMRELRMPGSTQSKVIVAPSMDAGVVMAEQLPMPPAGMVYQVWVMDGSGTKRGMETFTPGAQGEATAMVHGDFAEATRMEITVEPAGGSPRPSSPPVGVAVLG